MKPDGANMETTEPTEAAAVAEPSNRPENTSDQPLQPPERPTAAGLSRTKVNGVNGTTTGARPKTVTAQTKKQPSSKTESASGLRPGTTSRRPMNDARPTNGAASRAAPAKKPLSAPAAKPPGAIPKKPLGGASGGTTAKTSVKMPDKPKPTASLNRPGGPTAPKPSTSSMRHDGVSMKSSRPAPASTVRPAAKPSTAAATAKASSTVKTFASRAATAPSSVRTTAAQPNKGASAPAKKEISRPATTVAAAAAAARNKGTMTAATKNIDASKSTANVKSSTVAATVNAKTTKKPQEAFKPNITKKPTAATARFPAVNRVGQTPPGSPVTKSESSGNIPRSKQAHKPTQALPHFPPGKKMAKIGVARALAPNKAEASKKGASAAVPPAAKAASFVQETQAEDGVLLQGQTAHVTETVEEQVVTSSPSKNMHNENENKTNPAPQGHKESTVLATEESATAEPSPKAVSVALPPQPEDLVLETQLSHPPKTTTVPENGSLQVTPPNLNEDEEEEEKEASQLVSVSEMSGTTQPTEDSRPGSAGPVGAAWRVGGALLSELDSEEVSISQQGASELSAPGVLEGTESMDDLGEGSLKGAMDMEGASAGSPDFEKVPEIPVNDYDDEDDDNDRVCDMDVGSERTDEPQRLRHDNDVDDDDEEEDEDVEMASEGVTESGLESYGNADEDDFAEDERLDNLNRVGQPPPPPPLLPSAPAAQWDQPNPFFDPWAQPPPSQLPSDPDSQSKGAEGVTDSPMTEPCQGDSETPTQETAQTWLELDSATFITENKDVPQTSPDKKDKHISDSQIFLQEPSAAAACEQSRSLSPPFALVTSPLSNNSSDTSTADNNHPGQIEKDSLEPQSELVHKKETEGLPVTKVLDSAQVLDSNPSSSSVTEDEASDMEGEAQLEDSLETPALFSVFETQPHGQRALSTVEESEEPEDSGAAEDATPPSATSQVSSGFETTTSASNAQSTGESCVKSPGIFSLEELPEEAKEAPAQPSELDQPYIVCVKEQGDSEQSIDLKMENSMAEPKQLDFMHPIDDSQPPYYSAICEKPENSFAGFSALLHPQRRDHSSFPRTYCDIVKPVGAALASPKLSCADLPPRSPKQQPLSPQLRRLEQHQRHLLELQQRREQQSRPLEEAEQERKRREEEEERKKKDEAEEEIKRNKEEQQRRIQEDEAKRQELEQRKELELQLHQQQEELKQRQQIIQWQQELQESNKEQSLLLLSPSSGLCTIYEALENSEDEDGAAKHERDSIKKQNFVLDKSSEIHQVVNSGCEKVISESQSTHNSQDLLQRLTLPSQNGDSFPPPESPERPSPLDLDWGKKVDIVHQLINQTLMLNGDGCSSLLLLPGGAGGTLSPLESSLWPSLLPPLTPPSATVTSVSSFSPETTGSSPQGEWTVVELETHH